MVQRETTQRAQQNVMSGGTKRSFMRSMNNMNHTKSPGANFRPFYSGNGNSAANSLVSETFSKSRPDKRRKTQPSEKSYSEEVKVFVDNLDLGES